MTIANIIKQRLDQFSPGEVFTIQDFKVETKVQPTLVRYLNRQVAKNKIKRLSKGRYFIPRNSRFGQLPPFAGEVVKDLLINNGKIVGYISGTAVFASLGLTTQISSEITIGTSVYRRPALRGKYRIRFFLQRNLITVSNIPLLQLLDAIKYFREIPATTPSEAIPIIIGILKGQTGEQRESLAQLALLYPKYVRALLGAMFEAIGQPAEKLKQSLNGVTIYKLNIPEVILPTKTNWKIA